MPSALATDPVFQPFTPEERAQRTSEEMEEEQKFITAAKKRFEYCASAWEPVFKEMRQQWDFRLGNQWPEEIKARRTDEGRPCQTVNWTDQFILHVCNSQRQNEPEVRFSPVSSDVDREDAKMRNALYRHIEDYSQADIARDGGFEQSVTGGLGYWRATTEYINEQLNQQEICLRPIEDAATVYMDPKPKRIKDIRYPQYCFIVEDILWEDYKNEYPDAADDVVLGLESWTQAAANAPEGWVTKDTVRLAEYFYIDPVDKMCKWARISAFRVLEREDLRIPFVPIMQEFGEQIIFNGKMRCRGLTYNLMEAQVTLNYATSALSETAGMGPKSPYLMTPKMVEGFENFWDKLNKSNMPYMLFNPDPEMPQGPMRQDVTPPIQPMVVWCQQAEERFRMLTGIYNSADQKPTNQLSGKALNLRKQDGELATYHFVDNHTRAMQYESMVVSAMMKNVYDVPRVMQITQADSSAEAMVIGQAFLPSGELHPNLKLLDDSELSNAYSDDGKLKYYDPTKGDFNSIVHVGPSAPTQIAEANEGMQQLAAAAPELVPRWADLYVRNQTWKGKDELADRLTPPDVQATKSAGGPAAQVAQLTQQNQQLSEQFKLLQQELGKLTAEKQGKVVENQAKAQISAMEQQTKLKTTAMQTHAQLVGKLIEAKTDMSLAAAERQMKHVHHLSNLESEHFRQAHDNAHESGMAAVEHGRKKELADQAHENSKEQQEIAFEAERLTPKPDGSGL